MTAVASRTDVFARVLCAVDGTAEGDAAVLQSTELVAKDGALELIAVAETHQAALAAWSAARLVVEIERGAAAALGRAAELSPAASTLLARGHASAVLLHADRARQRR